MRLWIQGGAVGLACLVIGLGWILFANPLIKFLKEFVAKLADGSDQVASASSQISTASLTLAHGASEQASSLQETLSTMEEISTMTKLNADNAQEAAIPAQKCNDSALKGNVAVGEMCDSIDKINSTSMKIIDSMSSLMEEINASSNEIAEITNIIDSIAFQTNLLALNAAVEAARAGDHGKGFAVVADEVRNLAQRSATAAKDTAVLIKNCADKAGKGAQLTNKRRDTMQGIVDDVKKSTDNTNAALQEILNSVEKVVTLTNAISNASCEQSDGVNSVNRSVQQMDQVTQQNADTAEVVATTSEEMSAQAHTLLEQVKILAEQVGCQINESSGTYRSSYFSSNQVEHRHDKNKSIGANGNGKKTVCHNDPVDAEELIPMSENRIVEHDEKMNDF